MTSPATSQLSDIITKVRKLTGSPSSNQLSDQDISNYINTFYLYDLPENLQLLTLRTTYEFYTTPNVDAYPFPREVYRDVCKPCYIAGYQALYSQSREQFYMIYPQLEFFENVATGTGVAGATYTFTMTNVPVLPGYTYPTTKEVGYNVNTAVYSYPPAGGPGGSANLQSRVLISAIDATGKPIIAKDDGNGGFVDQSGNPYATGTVDYVNGNVTIAFPGAVPSGNNISAQYIAIQQGRPVAMLFYGDMFFLRPVPDNVYHVQMDAYMFPAQLLAQTDNSQLREWWQYLAYGAALKILTDRLDMDGIQRIMPFFKEQQQLVLRRMIVQNTNERTASIYSEQNNYPYGNGFFQF